MTTRQTVARNQLEPIQVPSGRTTVVATDMDRTFTRTDLHLAPEAIRKARELRHAGTRMILVTGRRVADLPLPQIREAFDCMVLEGGAIWGRPGSWNVPPCPRTFWDLAERIADAGHRVHEGWASFSVPAEAAALLSGEEVTVSRNVDRLDITLPGVDKATGLANALSTMGVNNPWVLGIGDSLNDLPLAEAAHHFVAVANAHPDLAAAAHTVAPHAAYRGFLWAIQRLQPEATP